MKMNLNDSFCFTPADEEEKLSLDTCTKIIMDAITERSLQS